VLSGRLLVVVALASATLALAQAAGTARAQSDACPAPPYPGDAASREAIAQWMAHNVALAALPRELPVMAALVESGMRNLQIPDVDSAGYFQMRVGIWNTGAYAGFPGRPDLQLQWFIDQASQVRRVRIAAGAPDPAAVETAWGAWIADVQRPAEQFRGRYQLRLAEARELVGAACVPLPAPGSVTVSPAAVTPAPAPAPDTTAPLVRIAGDRRQRALKRGAVVVFVACPAETCVAAATATLRLAHARRPPQLESALRVVAPGEQRTLRIALRGADRARVRRALRERPSVTASVQVLAADAAGNRTRRTRTVRIAG
jgi:hypothetical protein